MKRKIASLLLILLVFVSGWPRIASATEDTFRIFTGDDLRLLAQHCSYDKWSRQRVVILEADIDLGGEPFSPIPVFGGIFRGQGYSITGLVVTAEGSHQGLFRYLQEGATVMDLTVQGTVTPGGDGRRVGGIVGDNSGTITNCVFSGCVGGNEYVGGIAGRNRPSGTISDCAVKGAVHGESVVGGVAGENSGTIERCQNKANVNTTVIEQTLDIENLTVEGLAAFDRTIIDAMDIGGIAGMNTGSIENAENRGVVGYLHVAYNVGGIAGRQKGRIAGCENYGHVLGRKDVGGIVGQMEPDIAAYTGTPRIRELQAEINVLQSSLNRLMADVDTGTDALHDDLQRVEESLDQTKIHAESLMEKTESLLNKDIEEINRLTVMISTMAEKLAPVMSALGDAMAAIDRALPSLRQCLWYMESAMGRMPEMAKHYDDLVAAIQSPMDKLTRAGDESAESLGELNRAMELAIAGDMDGATEAAANAQAHLQVMTELLGEAFEELKDAQVHMEAIMDVLGALASDMRFALSALQETMAFMELAMGPMTYALWEMSLVMEYLGEQPPLALETTDESFRETEEHLFRSIDDLTDSVFRLIDTAMGQKDILLPDLGQVTDQLFLVIDLVLDIVGELEEGGTGVDSIFEDTSRIDVDRKTDGKVSDSRNFGLVEGDKNVGGIAGNMAIEYLPDAEEELSIKDRPTLQTVYKSRAILVGCEHFGAVVAKKNGAGGIVGSMDLGYVVDCVAGGTVLSQDGSYVGGIAGEARGPIDSCHVKSSLEGGDYVGGIAGFGDQIRDCTSIVTVKRAKAYVGAIAGSTRDGATVVGNYFASRDLHGIDGISYEGIAEPLTFSELLALPGIPPTFEAPTVRFWVDGQLVGTQVVEYGDILEDESAPVIPPKPGHYHRWESADTRYLTSDLDIHALYYPYVKTLSSLGGRDGPLPAILVEGGFTDRDVLESTLLGDGEAPEGGKTLERWEIVIPDDGNLAHIVRFLPPKAKKNLAIYSLQGDDWAQVDAKWNGKYLVFTVKSNPVIFALVEEPGLPLDPRLLLTVPAAFGLLLYITRRRRIARRHEPAQTA